MQPIVNFRDLGYVVNYAGQFSPRSLARDEFYELSDWSLITFPSGLVLTHRYGVKLLGCDNKDNLVAAIVHFSEPHVIAGTEINHDLIMEFYEKLELMVKKVNEYHEGQYPDLNSVISHTPGYMLIELEQRIGKLKPY